MAKPKHLVSHDPHDWPGPSAWCICGWKKVHRRAKVREQAATRHIAKAGDA